MNDVTELTGADWNALLETVKTSGVDFGLKLIVALIIFYVGRLVARMLVNGIQRIMQAQEVDKIL